MAKHINVKITGQVQGVGFRWSAYEKFVSWAWPAKRKCCRRRSFVDAEGSEDKLAA